jgi:hypothetical protein
MNTLSIHRPRPSIETRMPASCNNDTNRGLVNWLPWSVLKISGAPKLSIASATAAMQNSTSMVFDTHHASTLRLAQSITATRYKNPRRIGIYVMSAHHTWFGRSISMPRKR